MGSGHFPLGSKPEPVSDSPFARFSSCMRTIFDMFDFFPAVSSSAEQLKSLKQALASRAHIAKVQC